MGRTRAGRASGFRRIGVRRRRRPTRGGGWRRGPAPAVSPPPDPPRGDRIRRGSGSPAARRAGRPDGIPRDRPTFPAGPDRRVDTGSAPRWPGAGFHGRPACSRRGRRSGRGESHRVLQRPGDAGQGMGFQHRNRQDEMGERDFRQENFRKNPERRVFQATEGGVVQIQQGHVPSAGKRLVAQIGEHRPGIRGRVAASFGGDDFRLGMGPRVPEDGFATGDRCGRRMGSGQDEVGLDRHAGSAFQDGRRSRRVPGLRNRRGVAPERNRNDGREPYGLWRRMYRMSGRRSMKRSNRKGSKWLPRPSDIIRSTSVSGRAFRYTRSVLSAS